MPEPNDFDRSFYTLAYIGCLVLAGNALDTEAGRAKVKDIFRSGLLAAGSFEDAMQIPEFKKAVEDYEAAGAPGVDLSAGLEPVTPVEGKVV